MRTSSEWGVLFGSLIGVPVEIVLGVLGAAALSGSSEALLVLSNAQVEKLSRATVFFICLAFVRDAVKFSVKIPVDGKHQPDFASSFYHAIVLPHHAIPFEFFRSRQRTRQSRLGVLTGGIVGVPVLFILEVLGAVGAPSGTNEVFGLVNPDSLRRPLMLMGVLAFLRYITFYTFSVAVKDESMPAHKFGFRAAFSYALIAPHQALRRKEFELDPLTWSAQVGLVLGGFLGLLLTFALHVLGGAGAPWGSSKAFGLRNENNETIFRHVSHVGVTLALIRYCALFVSEAPLYNTHGLSFRSGWFHSLIVPDKAIQQVSCRSIHDELLFPELSDDLDKKVYEPHAQYNTLPKSDEFAANADGDVTDPGSEPEHVAFGPLLPTCG